MPLMGYTSTWIKGFVDSWQYDPNINHYFFLGLFGLGRFLWVLSFLFFLAAQRCGPEDRNMEAQWMDGSIQSLKSVILFGMSFVSFSAMEEVSRDRCILRSSRSYHSWKNRYESETQRKSHVVFEDCLILISLRNILLLWPACIVKGKTYPWKAYNMSFSNRNHLSWSFSNRNQ